MIVYVAQSCWAVWEAILLPSHAGQYERVVSCFMISSTVTGGYIVHHVSQSEMYWFGTASCRPVRETHGSLQHVDNVVAHPVGELEQYGRHCARLVCWPISVGQL